MGSGTFPLVVGTLDEKQFRIGDLVKTGDLAEHASQRDLPLASIALVRHDGCGVLHSCEHTADVYGHSLLKPGW